MKKNKNIINFLLLLGATILVLFFVMKDNFDDIVYQLGRANIIWIIAGIIFFALNIIFRTISFKNIACEFKEISFLSSLRLQLATIFFNGITPFASGGQPFVVVWLNKKKYDAPSSMNIVIQDFIVYQTALVLLGVYAITYNFFFDIFPANPILKNLVTIGFIINTLVIVLLYLVSFSAKFNKKVTGFIIKILNKINIVKDKEEVIKKWEDYVDDFSNGAKTLWKNKKLFITSILFNILSLAFLYIVPYAVARSLGVNTFNINEGLLASAYSMLVASFVPIPGSTGGLEYAFLQFFGNFVKDASLLSAIMILWRTITYYFAMIVGALALNFKKGEK